MALTLTPHLDRYFTGRRKRGELDPVTARKQRRKMVGLDESFGRRPLAHFGPKAIDRWLETIGQLAPSSRRHYLSVARGFGRWMLAEGLISVDPTAHVKRIRQPRKAPVTLTAAEVAQVLMVCDVRTTAIVWLMVGSGLRTCEVARLMVEDYDPRTRTVHVIGKGGNERNTPVPARAAAALDRYLDSTGRVAGPLIRSERIPTRGMVPSSVGRLVADAMTDSDVKRRPLDGRSPHGLRRTAGSDVLDACGGDIHLVQEMLGHASIVTTAEHYIRRVPPARLRAAMEGRTYSPDSDDQDLSPPALEAA